MNKTIIVILLICLIHTTLNAQGVSPSRTFDYMHYDPGEGNDGPIITARVNWKRAGTKGGYYWFGLQRVSFEGYRYKGKVYRKIDGLVEIDCITATNDYEFEYKPTVVVECELAYDGPADIEKPRKTRVKVYIDKSCHEPKPFCKVSLGASFLPGLGFQPDSDPSFYQNVNVNILSIVDVISIECNPKIESLIKKMNQNNSSNERDSEVINSTEITNNTSKTNQQTTSSSPLTSEQQKQRQQQKIAEIEEMERKAQEGSEEKNEKQTAKEFHEEHVKKNNDRVKKQQEQKKAEEQKRKEEQEKQEELRRTQALMEEKRKWEEQQEKQKQVQEQKQREREQTRENQQTAAELGVAAALVHLLIAKLIYADIPEVPDYYSFFNGNGMHHRIHGGYGLGFMPYDVENRTVTLDLGVGYDFDLLYGENGRLGISVGGNFGHMIQQLRYDFNYGLNGSFGSKPVKLNLAISQHRSMIKHSDWIDASSNYENKELWKFSRFSVGPRISWEEYNVHLDLMLGFNFHRGFKTTMTSFRANLRTHYEFEMFLEYNQLPLTSDYFGPPEKAGAFMVGLHRSWDYFIDGSRDYGFESLRSENYFDDHWYFSVTNPIISWGKLRRSNKRAEINQPNLAFTVFTVEKEFPIATNFTISGGLGFTTRRGFTGNLNYSNGATQSFIDGTSDDFTERIDLYSKGEIDIPIGLTYYFKSDRLNRFWSSVKIQPSFNLGTKQRFDYGNSEVIGFEDGNNFNTKLGFGLDIPRTKFSNYRIGLYHIWTRGFTKIPYYSKLRGVQLKFAIGI